MKKKFLKNIKTIVAFGLILFLPLFLLNLQHVQQILTSAFYTKAKINVDAAQNVVNYATNWISFAQGGEEPGQDMIAPVIKPVKNIKPQYIRLDHIFDDDYYQVVQRGENGIYYDFTHLDRAVNTILATGAKPMLVLSYFPHALSSAKTDLPDNWYEWQKLVRATIQRYSGINQKNISNVYYEVWNEPDLEAFGSFNYYGNKNYLTLYHYAAQAAKNATWCNPFKIGGPATTNLYQGWVESLIEYCRENNLPLSFISYHQYSFDIEAYRANIRELKQWLQKYPNYQNIEILLTEWGPDPAQNPVYNSNMAAAFSLAVASELNQAVDHAFAFEIKDGPTTNSWGLIGHEQNKLWLKPRYVLFGWLSTIEQNLKMQGNGTYVKAIAGKSEQTIVLLLTNYDPQSKHQELVPVRIYNLKPGKYRLKKQYLGQSPLYEDIQLDSSVFTSQLPILTNTVLKLELTAL